MLFIIPLIYGGQFKTKLQWLNAFYALSERLTCNFGGISGVKGGQTEGRTSAIHVMCIIVSASITSTWSGDLKTIESWISLGLNGDVWTLLPELFVCCCVMAISLLTFVIAANTPGNTLQTSQRPEMQQYWPIRARHDDIVQVSIILTSYLGLLLFSFSHTRHHHREQRDHVQCKLCSQKCLTDSSRVGNN